MAAITPVTMLTFFGIFIASVHDCSTYKCSFSNIEILSSYIEEKINATVSGIVAEVTSTMTGALSVMFDEKVDSLRAEISGTVSTLSATVDDRIRNIVNDRIRTVNTSVGALNDKVDSLRAEISGTDTTLSATVDDKIRNVVDDRVGERITTVSTTLDALDVSVAKLLSQPGKL